MYCVAIVQRPELDINRSVVSDPYSDPVTRYCTCGLSEKKKLNLSNPQICVGEYP